nr:MAG TPA_asm: hypothetical protein [Caudoviricetes sp.]
MRSLFCLAFRLCPCRFTTLSSQTFPLPSLWPAMH